MTRTRTLLLFFIVFSTFSIAQAFDAPSDWPGEATDWHGFARYDFEVDERPCRVIVPENAAPGRPWVWRARFPDFHAEADQILLERGFHIAHIDTNGMLGSPRAMAHWDAFYAEMTETYGLAPRPALEGVSRGGLFVYGYAARWPERVACIYADTPVCDFKSWPLGQGTGIGHQGTWQSLLTEYGFTQEEALAYDGNPIDNLTAIARARIPLLTIVSMTDRVVPPTENTFVLAERYRELGGSIDVIEVPVGTEPSNGHHFTHPDPLRAADFIERNATVLPPSEDGESREKDYFVGRQSLDNCRIRFERDKVGRVVFLGGSITTNPGWRDMTCEYLQARFPETEFEFINAGIPSTGSTPGAFRLLRDVFSSGPVDLLFEEAAVNDSSNARSPAQLMRGMEGILRHARDVNPSIDIVVMHFADPSKMDDYRAGRTPEVIQRHEAAAAHYGVSTIHLAQEVTERIDAGQFTWKGDFRNLHPSQFGQRLYASSIRRLLTTAWAKPLDEDDTITESTEGAPLDPFSYDAARLVPLTEATGLNGFEIVANCNPSQAAGGGGTRPGFTDVPMLVGDAPGDSFTFAFQGRAVGLFVAAGRDAGVIEYKIDDGEWKTHDLFTPWSAGLHIPWAYVLEDELEQSEHMITIRLSEEKNERSAGTVCRIVHLLVNE